MMGPNTVGSRQTDRLYPHPLNEKVYADKPDAGLLQSIKANGILNPIVVDDKKRILSGHRRWMAAKQLGLEDVPVLRYFPGKPTAERPLPFIELEIEQFIIESNRSREKSSGQKARETAELFRIEASLAAQRRASTLKQNVSGAPSTVPPSEGASGDTRDIVAAKTGQSKNTVGMQIDIVTRADAGDETAQLALIKLDKDETSVRAAYRMIMSPAQEKELAHNLDNAVPTPRPPKPKKPSTAVILREEFAVLQDAGTLQRYRLTTSDINSNVDISTGRYDLLLFGVTKAQAERIYFALVNEERDAA
jgi:hypothetical protein